MNRKGHSTSTGWTRHLTSSKILAVLLVIVSTLLFVCYFDKTSTTDTTKKSSSSSSITKKSSSSSSASSSSLSSSSAYLDQNNLFPAWRERVGRQASYHRDDEETKTKTKNPSFSSSSSSSSRLRSSSSSSSSLSEETTQSHPRDTLIQKNGEGKEAGTSGESYEKETDPYHSPSQPSSSVPETNPDSSLGPGEKELEEEQEETITTDTVVSRRKNSPTTRHRQRKNRNKRKRDDDDDGEDDDESVSSSSSSSSSSSNRNNDRSRRSIQQSLPPSSTTVITMCTIPSLPDSSNRKPLNHGLPWMDRSHTNALLWFSYPVYRLPYPSLKTTYQSDRDYLLCYDNEIFERFRYLLQDLVTEKVSNSTLFLDYSQYIKQIQSAYTFGFSLLEHWCPYDQYRNSKVSPSQLNHYLGHLTAIFKTLVAFHEEYRNDGSALLHPIHRYRLHFTVLRLRDELQAIEKETVTFSPPPCWSGITAALNEAVQPALLSTKTEVERMLDKDGTVPTKIRILRTSTKYFENEYIAELMPYPFIQDQIDPVTNPNDIANRCGKNEFQLFILQGPNGNAKQIQTIEVMRGSNVPFGIIHLSDENYEDRVDTYYSPPNLKFVMRNYYRHDEQFRAVAQKVTTPIMQTPIGYTEKWWAIGPADEFGRDIERRKNEREYVWIFVGSLTRANRRAVLNNIKNANLGNNLFFDADGYTAFAQQMPREEYAVKARKTLFQFVLWGNYNMETFRNCEALESGSIPILTWEGPNQKGYGYWDGVYGHRNPLMQIANWDDVPILVRTVMDRPEQLESYRLHLLDFWMSMKWFLRQQIMKFTKHGTVQSCQS